MRIAVITGASSGMGAEFARQIDRGEEDIDEIWLIARRKQRLEEVGKELSHPSRVFPLDLTKEESFQTLEDAMKEAKVQVGILVNCAGYGKIGNYAKVSRYDSINMIDVNCSAAVNITLSCLPFMRPGDRILQLCSTAAFQPLQHINIYGATKAFLYDYTRALRMELLPRKIAVTAVCPFWVKDTEFIAIAKKGQRNGEKPPIKSFPFATTSKKVVKSALRCSRRGYAVCTPGAFCTIHRIFAKIIPREALCYFWELMRRM